MPFIAPRLGVGMVFAASLERFLRRRPDALDVLVLEPQTLWLADDAFKGPFFEFSAGIELFAALPGRKLVHSVGVPLGGTRAPDPAQLSMLARTSQRVDSPWVSEHLSIAGTPHRAAGFMLPPLQTEEGVELAARNIRAFQQAMGRPVAVETGVAYFKRKPFELPDGEFLARVVEAADCGIVLDLHNLYCNERNGRIVLDDFLCSVPLDRVWEVHLAGGVEAKGYWLDAHSGPMPAELGPRAAEVLRALPNLGALTFEIYDTFLERLPGETLDVIVDELHELWQQAGHTRGDAPPRVRVQPARPPAPAASDWEAGLTDAVWKAMPSLHAFAEDADPLRLYAWLARSFRGSMLMRALPRALRYLLLRDGAGVERRLERYFVDEDPKLYTPLEADAFQRWLRADGEQDPLALALLDYDLAFIRIVRGGEAQVVRFPGNPGPVFEALMAAELPALPEPPAWELEIVPDGITIRDFTGSVAGS
jgi:uncharacterized protein (UPF0276 family)